MKHLFVLTAILYGILLQVYPVNPFIRSNSSISGPRFMVGLKGGITFTQPLITQKYNVLNPLDDVISQSGIKMYKSLTQNIGYQYGFTGLYTLSSSLDIRLEPTFATYIYKYLSSYFWESTGNIPERIEMAILHKQTLKYLEIPVTLRYLFGSGKARPFVQGGIFYGLLLNAIKSSERTDTYTNPLGTSTLNSENSTGDASTLYVKSRYGINAGIGVDYNLDAVHITLDINLNYGINKTTNEAGRYSSQQYSGGLYDVQDDISLIIPSVNIGILFPLRKPARSKMKCPV